MTHLTLGRLWHTLSITFRHFPPNSARFGHVTEGALSISAQLPTDAVSTLQKVWVLLLIRLWKQPIHIGLKKKNPS